MSGARKRRPRTCGAPRTPAAADLALVRAAAARIEPGDPEMQAWLARYVERHSERIAGDLALVRAHVPPRGRLLEYGAAPLLATATLAGLELELSSLDVAPERFAAPIEALGLDVRRCDVETEPVPFPDASFDAVLFSELFEHLRIDPIFTLEEVRRVLRPDGVLLLTTPNLRSLRGLKNLLLHGEAHAVSGGIHSQYSKLRTLGHMGHVREYTLREVDAFLTAVGFRVEQAVFRGGHGRGPVGLVERLAPSLRPFFALVARRGATPEDASA